MDSLELDIKSQLQYIINRLDFLVENDKTNSDRLGNLENYMAQKESTPFLPYSKGEGEEMAQIKDRLMVGVYPDGKPIYVWVTGKDKPTFYDNIVHTYDEHGMLDRLGIQVAKPVIEEPETRSKKAKSEMPTFKQFVEPWYEGKKQTIGTNAQKGYKSAFNAHLLPFFGDMLINEVTWLTIQNYLNTKKEVAKESLRNHINKLKVIFESALNDGLIKVNPAKDSRLKNPGKAKPRRKALTEQQREQIALALPAMDEKDAMYLAICLYAGTRKSETLGLQRKHITEDEILVRQQCQVNNKSDILPPKSECGIRNIPIQDKLKPFLTGRGNDDEYLFGKGTKPPTKYMFEKMWERIESHLQGIGFSSHILRHTFITECAEKDVPVNVTQQMAGHSTPNITLGTYTTVTEKMKQNGMQKLNSM